MVGCAKCKYYKERNSLLFSRIMQHHVAASFTVLLKSITRPSTYLKCIQISSLMFKEQIKTNVLIKKSLIQNKKLNGPLCVKTDHFHSIHEIAMKTVFCNFSGSYCNNKLLMFY